VPQPAFSFLERLASYVLAVDLEQIERAEDRVRIASVAADQIEHGQPIVVADDRLAIDHAGSNGERLDGRRGQRKPPARS
jgi:hypothetical protein